MNFVHRQVRQISAVYILLREVLFAYRAVRSQSAEVIYFRASSECLCQTRTIMQFLLMCFAKLEQRTTAILVWTMRICKAEPAKKRTAHRERERLIGMTRNYSYTKHQRMTKPAPQAMQAAMKRSRWKAWLSGQSGAKTLAISSLLTSPSRPRLTNETIFCSR
jgi:hypothetical protein